MVRTRFRHGLKRLGGIVFGLRIEDAFTLRFSGTTRARQCTFFYAAISEDPLLESTWFHALFPRKKERSKVHGGYGVLPFEPTSRASWIQASSSSFDSKPRCIPSIVPVSWCHAMHALVHRHDCTIHLPNVVFFFSPPPKRRNSPFGCIFLAGCICSDPFVRSPRTSPRAGVHLRGCICSFRVVHAAMAPRGESELVASMERCLRARAIEDGLRDASLSCAFEHVRVQASAYGLSAGRKPRGLAVAFLSDGARSVLLGFKRIDVDEWVLRDAWKVKYAKKVQLKNDGSEEAELKVTFETRRGSSALAASFEREEEATRCAAWVLHACKKSGRPMPKVQGFGMEQAEAWLENLERVEQSQSKGEGSDGELAEKQENGQLQWMGKNASDGWTDTEVHDTKVAEEEEQHLNEMLAYYNLDAGDLETLEETLRAELKALEVANVHEILQAHEATDGLLKNVDGAVAQLDDFDAWLETFHVKLKHMKADVAAIEARNNQLQTQASNNRKLLDEMEELQDGLSISPEDLEKLLDPKLDQDSLPSMVHALEALETAIARVTGEDVLLDPAYLEMKALQEQRVYLGQIQENFMNNAGPFLDREIHLCVDRLIPPIPERSNADSWTKQVSINRGLSSFIKSYKPLVDVCSRLDVSFRSKIAKQFSLAINQYLKRVVASIVAGPPEAVEELKIEDLFERLKIAFQIIQGETLGALEFMDHTLSVNPSRGDAAVPAKPTEFYATVERIHDRLDTQVLNSVGKHMALNRTLGLPLVGLMEILLADMDICMTSLILSCKEQLKKAFYDYIDTIKRNVGESLPKNAVDKNNLNGMPASAMPALSIFNQLKELAEHFTFGEMQLEMVENVCTTLSREVLNIANRIAQALPANKERTYLEAHFLLWDAFAPLENTSGIARQVVMDSSQEYHNYLGIVAYKLVYVPPFQELVEFVDKVERFQSMGISNMEIPYQAGTGVSELKKLLQCFTANTLEKKAKKLHRKVGKPFNLNPVLCSKVWKAVMNMLTDKYRMLAMQIEACYPQKKLPITQELFESALESA